MIPSEGVATSGALLEKSLTWISMVRFILQGSSKESEYLRRSVFESSISTLAISVRRLLSSIEPEDPTQFLDSVALNKD